MIPFSLLLFLIAPILIFQPFSLAQGPILVPKSESARPVHEFDFVYLPKETVVKLLPGFTRRELRIKSQKAAKILNITPPTDPRAQVLAIQKAHQLQLQEIDPSGQKRQLIISRLALLKQQLDVIVTQRNHFLSDLKRLQEEQTQCIRTNPSDSHSRLKCLAVDDEISSISSAITPLNQKERDVLRQVFDLRKQLNRM